MRLINADALKNSVLKWLPPDPCGQEEKEYPFETDICVSMIQEIENAPTIEPERKKGRWEYHSNPNIRGGMNPEDAYCSVCGFHVCTSEVDNFDDYNFCPNCGADMREDEE